MKYILTILIGIVFVQGCASKGSQMPAMGSQWVEVYEISQVFNDIKGTFVLLDREQNILFGYNKERAETRYVPASTFKVPNSLIAIETGVVTDINEILPYDKGDMSTKQAMAVSNVHFYKGIAQDIGFQNMENYITTLSYGNTYLGATVDDFWLDGSLRISAIEQVNFINALLQHKLPFSANSYNLLSELMPFEKISDNCTLYYKTGWGTRIAPGVGWVVGWIESEGFKYPFALNIEMEVFEQAPLRIKFLKESLEIISNHIRSHKDNQ